MGVEEAYYDVFVSYVRKGVSGKQTNDLIDRLRRTVNANGDSTRIFVDQEMGPGGTFVEKLQVAIGASKHFLALITSDYFQRDYCDWEFQTAFARDPSSRRGLIVPVIFEVGAEQTVKPEFRRIQQLSYLRSDFFETLCDSLGLLDPTSSANKAVRVINPALTKRNESVLTSDGFLIVRGVQFARITVSRGSVWLSRTPITVQQYKTIVSSGAMPRPPLSNWNWAYGDYPVVQIKWDEANTFCHDLGGRLPFLSEWLTALGGAVIEVQAALDRQSTNVWDMSLFDIGATVTGVRSEAIPNEYGFYDLVGNVWEWLGDKGERPNDRWVCGGPSASYRCLIPSSFRRPNIGFRCVIEKFDSEEENTRKE